MIDKNILRNFYLKKKMSMQDIADLLRCSLHKVQYWMERHKITRRKINEAVYLKNNPNGDPFKISLPKNIERAKLFGLGLGLYWGEGTKADLGSVRLGNTDPHLISKFINFLTKCCGVQGKDLHFGIQIFTDTPVNEVLDFWTRKIRIKRSQFYRPTITKSRSLGTYRKKSKYGVLTVYYHNKKLRDALISLLPMQPPPLAGHWF